MTLEFEGTRYSGWQEQRKARTVVGELRRALEEAGADLRDLGGAGRTRAGGRALAQVAHIRLGGSVDPERLRRDMNDLLPQDIHVLSLTAAPNALHAPHPADARPH